MKLLKMKKSGHKLTLEEKKWIKDTRRSLGRRGESGERIIVIGPKMSMSKMGMLLRELGDKYWRTL